MKPSQIERLLALAQRTGGTLIVTNERGEDPVVLMGISEYEALHQVQAMEIWGTDEESSPFEGEEGDLFAFSPHANPPLERIESPESESAPVSELPVVQQDEFIPNLLPMEEPQAEKPTEMAAPLLQEIPVEDVRIAPKLDESAWDNIGTEEQFYLEPLD